LYNKNEDIEFSGQVDFLD